MFGIISCHRTFIYCLYLEYDVCSSIQTPTRVRLSLLHSMHVDTIHRMVYGDDILCWCRESTILKTIRSNTMTFIKKKTVCFTKIRHICRTIRPSSNKAATIIYKRRFLSIVVPPSLVHFCSSFVWWRPYCGRKIQRIFVKAELFS
jgi:hypothetical protein